MCKEMTERNKTINKRFASLGNGFSFLLCIDVCCRENLRQEASRKLVLCLKAEEYGNYEPWIYWSRYRFSMYLTTSCSNNSS